MSAESDLKEMTAWELVKSLETASAGSGQSIKRDMVRAAVWARLVEDLGKRIKGVEDGIVLASITSNRLSRRVYVLNVILVLLTAVIAISAIPDIAGFFSS